jgi:hypothetical protein
MLLQFSRFVVVEESRGWRRVIERNEQASDEWDGPLQVTCECM